MKEFDTVIRKVKNRKATFIVLPFNAGKVYGSRKTNVLISFDGNECQGTCLKIKGSNRFYVAIPANIRQLLTKEAGEIVHVVIKKNEEATDIKIPRELSDILQKDIKVKEYFKSLSAHKQEQLAKYVSSADRAEIKNKRVAKIYLTLSKETESLPMYH